MMDNMLTSQSIGLKKRVQDDHHRIDEVYRVGVEVEACLLDDKAACKCSSFNQRVMFQI